MDAVHTGAAAVWIGGLFQLVVVTPHATRGLPDADRARVRAAVAGRFSRIALGSIVVLAATGTGRALWAVSSPAELWQTGYGRALLVKTALLACLVVLGYRNRRNLTAFGSIRRRGMIEIGLLGGVAGRRLAPDRPAARQHAGLRRGRPAAGARRRARQPAARKDGTVRALARATPAAT